MTRWQERRFLANCPHKWTIPYGFMGAHGQSRRWLISHVRAAWTYRRRHRCLPSQKIRVGA